MNNQFDFGYLLEEYIEKSAHSLGQLSRRADVPKTTIINWRDGATKRPRHWQQVVQVAAALELTSEQCDSLLTATEHPPLAALFQMNLIREDADRLRFWEEEEPQETLSPAPIAAPPPLEPQSTDQRNRLQGMPPLPKVHIPRNQLQTEVLGELVHSNMLVLWGRGGSGKTTLAIQIAHQLAESFPDGVHWWQPTQDCTLSEIQIWIAACLELSLQSGSQSQRTSDLRAQLNQRKRCLIILDDLQVIPDLEGLMLGSEGCKIIVTTRDKRLAYRLEASLIDVQGLDAQESKQLLTLWAEREVEAEKLIESLGGLPLALRLCGAQIRDEMPLHLLTEAITNKATALSALELGDPQERSESLRLTFEISYNQLSSENQSYFAWLGYFARSDFDLDALQAIWGLSELEAWKVLEQMQRYAILDQNDRVYQLHSLLHQYAQEQLQSQSNDTCSIPERHAIWHIRHALSHPRLLNPDADLSAIDDSWQDILIGVRWAIENDPELAAQAALLAFSERAALVEALGLPLIESMTAYAEQSEDEYEQALLSECIGELYLLSGDFDTGIGKFEQACQKWVDAEDWFAASLCHLRLAGARLLHEKCAEAAQDARQAQSYFAAGSPFTDDQKGQAEEIFYWFDMIYKALGRWEDLPEEDIIELIELARGTNQPGLEARALGIYRAWIINKNASSLEDVQEQVRDLALQAYRLWKKCGRKDRADDEISLAKYRLSNLYSQRTAQRFAHRRSRVTPKVALQKHHIVHSNAIRWWLQAKEESRIGWLGFMLTRYLGAKNRPKHPKRQEPLSVLQAGSKAYQWVEDILNISVLGSDSRRANNGLRMPNEHLLTPPQWKIFSGQRPLDPQNFKNQVLIKHYLQSLEDKLDLDCNSRI